MKRKIEIIVIIILLISFGLLLSSCSIEKVNEPKGSTSQSGEAIPDNDDKLPNEDSNDVNKDKEDNEENDENEIKFTGELITDGTYSGMLSFVPDKETKEYIQNNLTYKIDESMWLEYNDKTIVENLPKELGIYRVEIVPKISDSEYYMNISSIKLTDKIGTIEYEGKEYTTNELDENVRVKDRVCGLIVSRIYHLGEEKEAAIINFCGELEVEGYYDLSKTGELTDYINAGTIHATTESLKNIPNYKGQPIFNNKHTIYFSETNDLYKELSSFSAFGYGKFKIKDYFLFYGDYGMEIHPSEQITQIIELDERFRGMFDFGSKECTGYVGSTNNYILVYDDSYDNSNSSLNYYLIDKLNYKKSVIFSSESNIYDYAKTSDDRFDESEMFYLTTSIPLNSEYYEKKPIFRYNKNDGNTTVIKELNYTNFVSYGTERTVYEKQEYMGMKAEKISAWYYVEPYVDEFVKLNVDFSGEATVTGTLMISNDENFGCTIQFICDEEGSQKLPYATVDTRNVWFIFKNDNIEELVGTETMTKQCKITINNYSIFYAATQTMNSAELVSIEFLE